MSTNKVINVLPYLAIEERPNSYVPIDLTLLDITSNIDFENNLMTLEFIDSITMLFTEEEIRESIIRSNTVKQEYCSSPLTIIYKAKPLNIITKDNIANLNLINIINNCFKDKQEANKLLNKLNVVCKKYYDIDTVNSILNSIKQAIINGNVDSVISIFNRNIPYIGQREIVFYYYENKENKKEHDSQKLKRLKEEK